MQSNTFLTFFQNNFYRKTDKYPIVLTIVSIIVLVTLLNIQNFIAVDYASTGFTLKLANLAVNSILPTLPMIVINVFLYRRLKTLLGSGLFNAGANAELQKSIFRAKITMLISFIFISSQVLTWVLFISTWVSLSLNCNLYVF